MTRHLFGHLAYEGLRHEGAYARPTPECTPRRALACPIHGHCACRPAELLSWVGCPLHATTSRHALCFEVPS